VKRWEVPDDGEDPHRKCGDGRIGDPGDLGNPGDPGEPGDPIELPITDVIDLHSFRPAEVADVVREYLDAAYAKGLRDVRIIHGRGIGVQRRTVRVVLERDPRVVSFGDAAPEAGGWGATWVRLR
jgi:dsDNA-specific endonuclease/ATPase MutS2